MNTDKKHNNIEKFDYTKWQQVIFDKIPPNELNEKVADFAKNYKFEGNHKGRKMKNKALTNTDINDSFFFKVSALVERAHKNICSAINIAMVYTYYEMGKMIVEEEQQGKERAEYGAKLIKELSVFLTSKFGKGYSIDNLKLMRRFYKIYNNDQIGETLFSQLNKTDSTNSIGETLFPQFKNLPKTSSNRKFYLSWSHYLFLMRITNVDERHFYEIESIKNNWSLSELKRQFNSSLFERLALSKDKSAIKQLASQGQIITSSKDLVKDPYVLEFLGLPEQNTYSESELESKIIDNLQKFLLELGTGFTFVGRQVRFTFEEEHFRVDLVFFNRILKCFVLFDLKIGELKHQDIGQMQMYVNYYDRIVKLSDENPTIGIILCKDKKQAIVEMTLPTDNKQIFASKYETVLPSKEKLKNLLENSDN